MTFGNNLFVSLNAEQKQIPARHFRFSVTDGKTDCCVEKFFYVLVLPNPPIGEQTSTVAGQLCQSCLERVPSLERAVCGAMWVVLALAFLFI